MFSPVTSVPDAAIVMLKFCMNNNNYSGSPLSNKSILNLQSSDVADVEYLHTFSLMKYLSGLSLCLFLIMGTGGGSTRACVIPEFQVLL